MKYNMIGLWTESTLVQTRRNDIVINLSNSNRLQGWGEVVFSIVIWEIVLRYNLLDNFNWLPNLSNYILAIDAKTDNIAHLRPTEQSTTFASGISALAVDGNPGNQCYFPRAYSTINLIFLFIFSSETCSVTERASIDNQRWWSVKLPGAVNVRDVAITINHGVAFLQQFTVFVIGETFSQLFGLHYFRRTTRYNFKLGDISSTYIFKRFQN